MTDASLQRAPKLISLEKTNFTTSSISGYETCFKETFVPGDIILDEKSILIYSSCRITEFRDRNTRYLYMAEEETSKYHHNMEAFCSIISALLDADVSVEISILGNFFRAGYFSRNHPRWKSVYINYPVSVAKNDVLEIGLSKSATKAANMLVECFIPKTSQAGLRRLFTCRFEERCSVLLTLAGGDPLFAIFNKIIASYQKVLTSFHWPIHIGWKLLVPSLSIIEDLPVVRLFLGPISICEEILSVVAQNSSSGWKSFRFDKICLVKFLPAAISIEIDEKYVDERKWNSDHQYWCKRTIFDFCLSFPELPPYVCLEILDWLGEVTHYPHQKKIAYIFSVQQSIRKILAAREK